MLRQWEIWDCFLAPLLQIMITFRGGATGGGVGGGKGGDCPQRVSKKEKKLKYGVFSWKKIAFLSSLIRNYMLWEGFYHDFSTKKVSASGGFAPWPPPRGSAPWTPARGHCPLDPRGNFAPSNDLPWRHPWLHLILQKYGIYSFKRPSF